MPQDINSLITKFGGRTTAAPATPGANSDLIQKYGGAPAAPPPVAPQAKRPGLLERIFTKNIPDFFTGAGKGLVSTAAHTSAPLRKVGNVIGDQVSKAVGIQGRAPEEDLHSVYTTKNAAEKAGFGAEQIAEFLLPAGTASKAEKAIVAAVDASKAGTLTKVITKLAGKAAIEGAVGGTVRTAQTGDLKEGAKAAATFGAIKLGTGAVGAALKAVDFPEWLYSKLFKNTYQDMYQELDTNSLRTLQETKPDWFKTMTERGIIKVGKDGAVVVDDTLAKQALDRGLQGSIKNMAVVVRKGLADSEAAVKDIAATHADKTIRLSHPETYARVLNGLSKEFEDVGFGEISAKTSEFAQKAVNGVLTPEEAIGLRRLLDGLRIKKSYIPLPNSPLSLGQQNLKTLSDTLRTQVNHLPGMAKVMEEYSFNIDALDILAKEAARRGNKEALGLIDSMLISGGIGSGAPGPAIAATVARKVLASPTGLTRTGQIIEKGGSMTKTGAAAKGALTQVLTPRPNR